jgi:LCP family protein required for cell wall assembly
VTPRTHRLLRRTAAGLAVLVLVLAGTAYGAYRYYDGKITRIALPSLGHGKVVATGSYFLLAGSDTRAISDGAAYQSTSSAKVDGQRADTVILVHIPSGSAKATLVSFPRDSYVTIPSYTDTHGVTTPAHRAKLNEAFSLGGADLLIHTVEELTGLPVDHYLQVNFDGFRKIVNAVGGVTLCVGTTRDDTDSGDHLTAGTHRNVSGNTALAFVRDRKGLAAGDLARIQDQQYFVSQVLKKVLSAGTLANPGRLSSLLSATTESLTTDKGFGLSQISTLATRLKSLDASHVTFLTLPVADSNGHRIIHGTRQSVVLLDETKTQATFDVLAGKTPAAAPPASAKPSTKAAPKVTAKTATASTCAV